MYIRRCSQHRAAVAAAGARTTVHPLSPLGHRDLRGKLRRLLRSALGILVHLCSRDRHRNPERSPLPPDTRPQTPALQASAARGSLAAGPH